MGIVTNIQNKGNSRSFTVNDGTGTIIARQWLLQPDFVETDLFDYFFLIN